MAQAGKGKARGVLAAVAGAGAWLAAVGAPARVAEGQTPAPQVLTGDRLLLMSAAELDALYRAVGPGIPPRGKVHGLPIVSPGSPSGPTMSRAARVVWQGKVFDDDGAGAVNRFFGARMIRGNVYQGASWLDGRPSLVLDYQGTSLVYGRYRDEIRQVGPGLYLGVMFARTRSGTPKFTRYFAFETMP
jgi:hypothetical protein